MNLTIETSAKLTSWGFYFIGFVLPIIVFLLLRRIFPDGNRGSHEKVSIVSVWLLMTAYMFWTTPIRIAYRQSLEGPDCMYDGTGANSFTLVFGWILPFFSLLLTFGISAFIRYVYRSTKRRSPNPIA
jgi:hypothetical protein